MNCVYMFNIGHFFARLDFRRAYGIGSGFIGEQAISEGICKFLKKTGMDKNTGKILRPGDFP